MQITECNSKGNVVFMEKDVVVLMCVWLGTLGIFAIWCGDKHRSKQLHWRKHHLWVFLTFCRSFLIGCGTSPLCRFIQYVSGVKTAITTHGLRLMSAQKSHAKNTSITCQMQSPQHMQQVKEKKKKKRERCQAVIYDLKRQINSSGCLTGPETSWITT